MATLCALCGAAAPTVCANCGTAAYCSKEHQRQHWPEHRPGCFPCTLQRNEQLGRFLSTSRAVATGTLLVKEWPLVAGPCAGARPLCLGCHCPLQSLQGPRPGGYRCTGCGAAVCDAECEKLAAHSEWECRVLGAAGALLDGRPELVLPLRCLIGVRSGTAAWKSFLDLEAHLDKRRSRPVWEERQKGVVEVLRAAGLLAADGSEDELLQRVCAILDVNSFEVRGPAQGLAGQQAGEQLRAVFLRAAMMSHSCVPNVQLAVDDQLQLTVRATCEMPRASALKYNYCELLETTVRRQEHLREGKYFECSCERCADPTECGTHLSSLWCPHCQAGLVSPVSAASPPRAESRTPTAPRSRKRPAAHALQRMQQLCQEIVDVLERLLPGRVSRLKGIALHEMHVAVALGGALGGHDGEAHHLQRARDLLQASLHHLQHEPRESPEGRLHLLALQELDAVEDSIRQDMVAQLDPHKSGGAQATPGKARPARRGKRRQ
ncbi:SET domain-containing protein SmydA-8-like [Thrips palmi]|uniref:SET domain-containing protein SmydA-8-like n=1 Tax=Thrips palmi TaxID=161013 RepID=A0A6P8Z4N8_THRPL|nr:SET domain-containing protein SmydA-8-like [Thrips palmi]